MLFKEHQYEFFASYIFEHTGIHYQESNYFQLDSRIKNLLKFLECDCVDKLITEFKTKKDKASHQMLIDLATNNETYFFRDPVMFSGLRKSVYPIIKEKLESGGDYRVWSAACSSGQEINSVIMSFLEEDPAILGKKIQFDATDISSEILDKARSGIYTQLEVQRGLPIMMLSKYFEPETERTWRAKANLKQANVNFSEFNLLTGHFPVKKYDLIFCRNVLIYQKKENKSQILEKLSQALRPGGLLIMGNTENTHGLTESFENAQFPGVSFYQVVDKDLIKKVA
ncbi:MAG: protein-glutamate O-methyltransferase CheR [Bdellovibrionales bacterium]